MTGEQLKFMRLRLHLPQYALGYNSSDMCRWERGKRPIPQDVQLILLEKLGAGFAALAREALEMKTECARLKGELVFGGEDRCDPFIKRH